MNNNQYTHIPWAERFWNKVNKNGPVLRSELGPCWVWTGTTTRLGYGMVRDPETHKMVPAHRIAFKTINPGLPNTLDVCHKCDNPPCVRPDHLFSGTELENSHDMVRKGRAGLHKIGPERATEIRKKHAAGITQKELAKEYNVDTSSISYVVSNKIWREEVISASI